MARTFTGTSYFLGTPAGIVANPLTLAGWFRPADIASGGSQTLISLENAAGTQYIMLRSVAATGQCSALLSDGAAAGVATTPGSATLNVWAHCAGVFASGTSRTAYFDGVASTPETTAVSNPTITYVKLGYLWGQIQTAKGDLAEFGVWQAALTGDEIAALAKGVSPLLIRPAALLVYYPLMGAGTTEPDRWRNRWDLTVTNAAPPAPHPRLFVPWHTTVEDAPIAAIRFQAAPIISLASAGALTAPVRFAAAASLAIAVTSAILTAPPAPMQATAGLAIGSSAFLSTTARLSGTAGIRVSSTASFVPPTMLGAAGFTIGTRATIAPGPRETLSQITIGGVDVKGRVRMAGLTIRDVLNDAPNTCSLVIQGDGPAVGQPLRITLNEGTRVLFAGQVQSVDQAFESKPEHVAWAVQAIDDTAAANYRRPFGTWVDTSATTIAQAITATYAPTFSTAGIAAGLPPVSIVFDGADTFIGCLARLANAIGGYCKVEDGRIYLFLVDTAAAPDPIDQVHRFLHTPAIQANVDSSQLRTRVYGKGYGENIQADLAAGESLVPIQDGVTFPPFGGLAIAATTPDGAQSERIAFTGVELQGGGTLVGPGAGPTVAPVLALAPGAGVTNGRHDVAVVFVTATGKSLPGPFASVDVPYFPPPPTAPLAAAATGGTGPDPGSHDYGASFVTSFGETTLSPISNAITTSASVGEIFPPGANMQVQMPANPGAGLEDGAYVYAQTFVTATGETIMGPAIGYYNVLAPNSQLQLYGILTGPPGTTARRIYRSFNFGGYFLVATIGDNTTTTYLDTKSNSALGAPAPTSNTTGTAVQRIPVSNIPIGPPGTTARNLYRRFNGSGSFRLVTTLGNNTTTTFTDAVPNTSLGAAALATPTAVGNQIIASVPVGASVVTQREIYMSPVGTNVRRLALVIPNNTATSATITASDATLGAAGLEPIADTSGLQQPNGQVNPGSTTLPVAAAATFLPGGGWVILSGGQVVRYAAISGQTLTGIPAAGSGAITTTVLYGSQAIPAPMLVGVTGLGVPVLKGSAVHIWVQRDDLLAQAEQRARAGGTGVVEFLLVDTRRGLESLTARCDADLALFSRPIVTVAYATRDLKTQSGKQITVDLDAPRIHETLTIQEVTITEIDLVTGLAPRFTVRASTVRFSLEDTLRRLIAGGSIVGGSS